MSGDRVHIGTPITTEQAARGILRLIRSPIVGDVDLDRDPGSTIARLEKFDSDIGTMPFACLSAGERRLYEIAKQVWQRSDEGVGLIGGLDLDNRRKVLVALFYLHLGRDLDVELDQDEFDELLGSPRRARAR